MLLPIAAPGAFGIVCAMFRHTVVAVCFQLFLDPFVHLLDDLDLFPHIERAVDETKLALSLLDVLSNFLPLIFVIFQAVR